MNRSRYSSAIRMRCLVVILLFMAFSSFAQAQEKLTRIWRIGYLTSFGSPDDLPASRQLAAFRQGLKELGYLEGKNISIHYRYPRENPEQLPQFASELVRQIDILIAVDPTAIRAAKQATNTIPIVIVTNQEPVGPGFVQSLAHPGGNVTGVTRMTRELSGKRLELVKEVVPNISRAAVLWVRPTSLGTGTAFKNYEPAASALKIQLQSLEVQRPTPDIDGALQAAVNTRSNGLVVVSNAVLRPHAQRIAELAIKYRLPTICEANQYVDAGCLTSYSSDDAESFRRAAIYVDKILRGANPGSLPVEQPTKFELAISLKTAKQIGLTIPPNVLARADRVIR